ncbi:hypothetical protein A19Y_3975 [Planktothrix agardhii NIVA-CYA 126/8]|uniref:Uncharacterized protein n=1 Tax=Planktothrix agardhii (strain NIVA-CYA 126/8) TaxID=388467 RepID=A0A073CK67_PLAA1|nr:hypothetical protein [Planktothrix agardhii]KEI68694.1 hypothetical protein A19Y_3975 [Planktothrix agardhii NIVA-CYA 126/8]
MELVKLGKVADFINGKAFKPSDWEDKGKKLLEYKILMIVLSPIIELYKMSKINI